MDVKGLNDFYRSKEWVLFRLSVINDRLTDSGEIICEHCGKPIVRQYDCIAHHVCELTVRNFRDTSVSLNADNIKLVHHRCHNAIHNKLGRIERGVYLVYGSPLSGKSTWVDSVVEPGDLVVDVDRIWECVSGCARYVKPDRLKDVVFAVRDNLLESVRYRRGSWKNAYVIGGYPLISERERLCRSLGAQEIYIECSKEECVARLKSANDGRSFGEWEKYIDDWWIKYAPRA